MPVDRAPRHTQRRRVAVHPAQRGVGRPRLSCPCCAPTQPDRPRPSLRLSGWLSRGANARAAIDHPFSDSLLEDLQP